MSENQFDQRSKCDATINEKLDLIIDLLHQLLPVHPTDGGSARTLKPPTPTVEPPNNEPLTIHLNKSKFVNEQQREQILNYIKQENVRVIIKSLPKHKQQSMLRSMIKKELNVDVGYYTAAKLTATISGA